MPDRPLSLFEKAQHQVARALLRLPPRAQVALSGRRPVHMDGQTLHPELQLLLALRARMGGAPMGRGTPQKARALLRREALVHRGPECPVGQVRELTLDTPHRPLRARLYLPQPRGEAPPLLVFFHGGGYALGDLDTHDGTCRLLCCHAQTAVLSVEYALAPEFPFPKGLEDATAAFVWATGNAQRLGADGRRVSVGGDSAGAGLSAAISYLGTQGQAPLPTSQLLLYPVVERDHARPSFEYFKEGFFLTAEDVRWFGDHYLKAAQPGDPRAAPLEAPSFEGLPPTLVVTAGFDPLRDEGEAYAQALRAAGVTVELRRFANLIHGFASMTGVSPACEAAVLAVCEDWRRLLERDARREGAA